MSAIEEATNLNAKQVYKKLNWSRSRYWHQKDTGGFPTRNLEHLRKALNLDIETFYAIFVSYLVTEGIKNRRRATKNRKEVV